MQTISITNSIKPTAKGNIIDRVKSFEDACRELGIDGDILTGSINDALGNDKASITAYTMLIIIARALNEGWVPDWSDGRQSKYIPWFEYKSGFGLSCSGFGGWNTHTSVGSRLCFKNKELAKYAGEQFIKLYEAYFIIDK